jgi:hemerythrin-like domain-containing protein
MARRHESLIPLSRQHHHALVLALVIRRRDGRERGEAAWLDSTAATIRGAYAEELAGHFEVEEDVLFPEMERHLGRLDLLAQLREEHRTLRGLVASIEAAPGVSLFDDFASRLDAHVHKEEQRLFAEFEARMPAGEALKLGREIDAGLTKACPRYARG